MNLRLWLAALLLLACALPPGRAAESGPIVVIPVRSEISAAQFYFLRRAVKEAERDGASAVVLDMETYGGDVKAAIENMDALLKTRVPTFTYINNKAISAGALIALATRSIYMAPTAVIGAAAPVLATGEDLPKSMTDKTVSTLSAMARAAAQKNGHNPDLADAFISKEKEVKIGEVVVDGPGSLLTLSAEEAARELGGKRLLAAGVAASLDDVVRLAGLRGEVRRVEPAGFEQLALWITALAPLLLIGGIVGAWVEYKTPGFGVPGLLAAVCFALFFAGHYLAGLAGAEVWVVFALGVVLVLVELLLAPGTVLPGVTGALLIVGSLIWAMVDRYPSQPWWPSSEQLGRPLANFALALVAAGVVAALLARWLPRTSLYGRIVLAAATPSGPGVSIPTPRLAVAPGASGTARTPLRPSGRAEFAGEPLDVVSRGEWIEAGAAVRVVAVDGTRVVVEGVVG